MRMELPERLSDITHVLPGGTVQTSAATDIAATVQGNSLLQSYFNKAKAINGANPLYPTIENQNAECLYLIVASVTSEDGSGLEQFSTAEIGDVDGDGLSEFLDGWGKPIQFLRWPAGFQLSDLQVLLRGTGTASGGTATITAVPGSTINGTADAYRGGVIISRNSDTSLNPANAARITGSSASGGTLTITYTPTAASFSEVAIMGADPFNPQEVASVAGSPPSFATYPLIFSAGPDKFYGVFRDGDIGYNASGPNPNINPVLPIGTTLLGNCENSTDAPPGAWLDNIHNHRTQTR